MTREELEEMSFDELVYYASNECEIDNLYSYDLLKELAMYELELDNVGYAIHLLETIYETNGEIYIYDRSMGCLETPTPINTCEELIDFILEQKGE